MQKILIVDDEWSHLEAIIDIVENITISTMPKIKCDCGRIIDLKPGEDQMEYYGHGDNEDIDDERCKCKFCGKVF